MEVVQEAKEEDETQQSPPTPQKQDTKVKPI